MGQNLAAAGEGSRILSVLGVLRETFGVLLKELRENPKLILDKNNPDKV
jgi:hypothetical protein